MFCSAANLRLPMSTSFAQVGKDAVIIDERFNGGGALATDIIEFLQRKLLSLVATRDGEDEPEPQGAIFGPKVMLINDEQNLLLVFFRRSDETEHGLLRRDERKDPVVTPVEHQHRAARPRGEVHLFDFGRAAL